MGLQKIYLLRHGQTEWTISGRHTGITEVPLTPHGEEEARAMGQRLRGVIFQRVLTSPRLRARRTCELAGWGAAAEVVEDLHEWNYGAYEGLLPSEILARQPGWNVFDDGCPGGETPADTQIRADRLLATLRKAEGNIALFSHGHFTRVLAARWVGLPVAQGQILASTTGSVSILGFNGTGDKPVIHLWNMTSQNNP